MTALGQVIKPFSYTYLSEMSRPDRRGFYSGVWMMTNVSGQLQAVLTLLALQGFVLDVGQFGNDGQTALRCFARCRVGKDGRSPNHLTTFLRISNKAAGIS